ncbi:MAG: tripartite tricarboxylate transporter TctB family protein [Paracoccaceae bacterium]|nr:MAG: tripartite tricarboxylate transporter TctB family protein [Paracoccaceae bacterium]
MRLIETIPAAFLLAVAGAVFLGTAGLNYWDGFTPGARFFPGILSATGAAIALLLLWAQSRGIESVQVDFPRNPVDGLRVVVTIVALCALAYGAPRIGFVPMLFVFVLFMLLAVLRQRIAPSLVTALIVAGFTHAVFIRWLSVPMPQPLGF